MPSPSFSSKLRYRPSEAQKLPESLRPKAPPPEASGCAGCSQPVEPLWMPPSPYSAWQSSGSWSADNYCEFCKEELNDGLLKKQVEALAAQTGMPARYNWVDFAKVLGQGRQEHWASFRDRLQASEGLLGITPWNAIAAKTAINWAPIPRLKPLPLWLYLTGPVGSGKTTIACGALMSAIREIVQQSSQQDLSGISIRWMATSELWELLRQQRSAKVRQNLIAELSMCSILALDDLGSLESTTPWHRNAMELIITTRYNHELPTILTSNLRLDSRDDSELTIAKLFGERVVSRVVECIGPRKSGRSQGYIEIAGMDWRADLPHQEIDRAPSPSIHPLKDGEQLDLWSNNEY